MEEETYYGITYKKEKVNDHTYLFLPQKLVEGTCREDFFYAKEPYPILMKRKDLESVSLVVDNIYTKEELCRFYEMDDFAFLKEYFLDTELDSFLLVQFDGTKIIKRKMDITKCFLESPVREMYSKGEEDIVTLNSVALRELLDMQDVGELKERLKLYRTKLASFKAKNEKDGITKITLENGKMKEIETGKKKKKSLIVNTPSTSKEKKESISLKGLENYIKERVFGQEENIRKIAKTLFMNYTAIEGEKVESILLVGPTGTGKTATMKAAMEYLDIPFIEVNSINLVPQGIKGTSLEDCLHLLTLASGMDVQKAEQGILFFDEFDKLGASKTDHKGDIIPILLQFIEGHTFYISPEIVDDYPFNTSRLTKVFAGSFSDLFTVGKMGFNPSKEEEIDIQKRLIKKEYFGKELITRIPHILLYSELSREEKRRYLLESKLSPLLLKKNRYQRQFAIELTPDDSYISFLLDQLEEEEKSMRELSNKVLTTLEEAEYEMGCNTGKYKQLVLTRNTVENPKNFKLF